MFTAACPSCGAPVTFQHAALVAAVCERCSSTVVRDGADVRAIGKVAPFVRDLSPMQVGARGSWKGRGFEVAGVLRKGRARVRWNEWAVAFDDGASGWLAEGNGIWQIFPDPGLERKKVPAYDDLKVGRTLDMFDARWFILEVGEAAVTAAEGALPEGVVQGQRFGYADLREVGGVRTATIDYADAPPTIYLGEAVDLPALGLSGLRAFLGWSDPALVHFQGPEVSASRKLECAGCGAGLSLRAPADAAAMTCEYCGSELSVAPDGALLQLIARGEKTRWKPTLALGKRGTLRGLPWEVIGAMERSVMVEGIRYAWIEHLLHNPYRGYRWLIDDATGHWSLVEPLATLPASGKLAASWGGQKYDAFQRGDATVDQVLGEFTWEVHRGDRARTLDLVAPPHMLSFESTDDEVAWSHGTWLPVAEVAAAFQTQIPNAQGVAPHQPNPYREEAVRGGFRNTAVVGLGALMLLWVLQSLFSASEVLFEQTWTATSAVEDVWVGTFTVPDAIRRGLYLDVDSGLSSLVAQVHVAIVDTTSGQAFLPETGGGSGTARVNGVGPGPASLRVEVAKDPTALASVSGDVTVRVVRDEPWRTPLLLMGLLIALGPFIRLILDSSFEKRRWQNSDFGGGA